MRFATAVALAASTVPVVLAADCAPLEFIFARATTEPPTGIAATADRATFEAAANKPGLWSKGYGAAGHSLWTNVSALIPAAHGTAVNYPASTGGMDKGVSDMISLVKDKLAACPQTKFVLGGHSQGGMVTVNAIPKMDAATLGKVIAVTMFGAPACPPQVQDRCKSYCNKGDFVCDAAPGSKGPGGLKGAAGKGLGGPPKDAGAAPPSAAPTSPASAAAAAPASGGMSGHEGMAGMGGMAVRSTNAECDANVPERGREAKGSNESPHLLYNKDGVLVKAAACYIKQKFDAAK